MPLLASIVFAVGVGTAAAIPRPYQNCAQLNTRYPHGVGKVGARDATKLMSMPVTNFKRNNELYLLAITHNKRLDPDHDGIACEKQ